MRRLGLIAAVWIALVFVTIGVRSATSSSSPSNYKEDLLREQSMAARNDLLSRPLRGLPAGEFVTVDSLEADDPQLATTLKTYLLAQKQAIQECRKTASSGLRESEWIEYSFVLRADAVGVARLEDPAFERASFEPSPEVERCVTRAVGQLPPLQLPSRQVPDGRIRVPACFPKTTN